MNGLALQPTTIQRDMEMDAGSYVSLSYGCSHQKRDSFSSVVASHCLPTSEAFEEENRELQTRVKEIFWVEISFKEKSRKEFQFFFSKDLSFLWTSTLFS